MAISLPPGTWAGRAQFWKPSSVRSTGDGCRPGGARLGTWLAPPAQASSAEELVVGVSLYLGCWLRETVDWNLERCKLDEMRPNGGVSS